MSLIRACDGTAWGDMKECRDPESRSALIENLVDFDGFSFEVTSTRVIGTHSSAFAGLEGNVGHGGVACDVSLYDVPRRLDAIDAGSVVVDPIGGSVEARARGADAITAVEALDIEALGEFVEGDNRPLLLISLTPVAGRRDPGSWFVRERDAGGSGSDLWEIVCVDGAMVALSLFDPSLVESLVESPTGVEVASGWHVAGGSQDKRRVGSWRSGMWFPLVGRFVGSAGLGP